MPSLPIVLSRASSLHSLIGLLSLTSLVPHHSSTCIRTSRFRFFHRFPIGIVINSGCAPIISSRTMTSILGLFNVMIDPFSTTHLLGMISALLLLYCYSFLGDATTSKRSASSTSSSHPLPQSHEPITEWKFVGKRLYYMSRFFKWWLNSMAIDETHPVMYADEYIDIDEESRLYHTRYCCKHQLDQALPVILIRTPYGMAVHPSQAISTIPCHSSVYL